VKSLRGPSAACRPSGADISPLRPWEIPRTWDRSQVMGRPLSPASELPCDGRYLQSIAPTPLIPVRLEPEGPAIWCKLEFLNPSGSTKDRIARYMVEKAWRTGQLKS